MGEAEERPRLLCACLQLNRKLNVPLAVSKEEEKELSIRDNFEIVEMTENRSGGSHT